MNRSYDKMLYGAIAGLIGPMFGFLIFYLILFSHMPLINFIKLVKNTGDVQAPTIAVSLIFNLVFFFIALRKNWNRAAQGVILAMFIYAPIIIILKYA